MNRVRRGHDGSMNEVAEMRAKHLSHCAHMINCITFLIKIRVQTAFCKIAFLFSFISLIVVTFIFNSNQGSNRLQAEHLAACLRLSINGLNSEEFNYERALELFFLKSLGKLNVVMESM